jgi:pancreatic triacylglycerol lipase
VEVLHTTAGFLGYDLPLGDLDFYANGGTHQSGCSTDINCSHVYSYAFYQESVEAPSKKGPQFVGTACETYEDAFYLECKGERDAIFGGPEVKTG